MSERPKWCEGINCPNYPGGKNCCLKNAVLDGWPSKKGREEEFERIRQMYEKDPQSVIDYCIRISFPSGFKPR